MNKLSILICTLDGRENYLKRLMNILEDQKDADVEILINKDGGEKSIGQKRNELLEMADNDFISFVDDDDIVSPDYIELIKEAIHNKPDVVGIHLRHFEDDVLKGLTFHSMEYDHWFEEIGEDGLMRYYRNPNHLNPVKRELAIMTKFPLISYGEDRDYSQRLYPLLHTENMISAPIYDYMFRTMKS